jgi:hypothetical protein
MKRSFAKGFIIAVSLSAAFWLATVLLLAKLLA